MEKDRGSHPRSSSVHLGDHDRQKPLAGPIISVSTLALTSKQSFLSDIVEATVVTRTNTEKEPSTPTASTSPLEPRSPLPSPMAPPPADGNQFLLSLSLFTNLLPPTPTPATAALTDPLSPQDSESAAKTQTKKHPKLTAATGPSDDPHGSDDSDSEAKRKTSSSESETMLGVSRAQTSADAAIAAISSMYRKAQQSANGAEKPIVFLGGACNPTTWRKDTAIPMLTKHSVASYNPQVDEWYEALIKIEQDAKDSARVLFFVINNQTRGIASLVEISTLAAQGRTVVVCFTPFSQGDAVGDDVLDANEIDEINRAHLDLQSLLKGLENCFVHNDIVEALEVVVALMKPQSLSSSPSPAAVNPSLLQHLILSQHPLTSALTRTDCLLVAEVVESASHHQQNDRLPLQGIVGLLNDITGRVITTAEVKSLMSKLGLDLDSMDSSVSVCQGLDILATAMSSISSPSSESTTPPSAQDSSPPTTSSLTPVPPRLASFRALGARVKLFPDNTESTPSKRICLFGMTPALESDRASLDAEGLSYIDVTTLAACPPVATASSSPSSSLSDGTVAAQSLAPFMVDASMLCAASFIHIRSDQRSISDLIVTAAVAVGVEKGPVVVCLEDCDETTTAGGRLLTPTELKDLNRGRAYLKSALKLQPNAFVSSDIQECISHLKDLCS